MSIEELDAWMVDNLRKTFKAASDMEVDDLKIPSEPPRKKTTSTMRYLLSNWLTFAPFFLWTQPKISNPHPTLSDLACLRICQFSSESVSASKVLI